VACFAFVSFVHRKVQEIKVGLEMSGRHQVMVYADINFLGHSINSINENTETLLEGCRDVGLEINTEKTKYKIIYLHPNSRQSEYKDR
jgi:hypothetical protein